MNGRTKFEAAIDKRRAVKTAEAAGQIADSMEVRKGLIERIQSGEITLQDAQSELAKIKRTANRQGKLTRAQAFSRG